MSEKHPMEFDKIRSAAKAFIDENYPAESSFFEAIWAVIESQTHEWADLPPENWPLMGAIEKLHVEIGLADDQAMDLVTPRFLAMLFATVFDVASESPLGETWQVGKALDRYARRFHVPADVVNRAEPMVRMLLRHDYEKVGVFPSGALVDTIAILRWDRDPLEGFEEELSAELKQARGEKLTFDIYLDDLHNEFLIKGKKKELTLEPKKLLILLLRKVGVYWNYSDLLEELWYDPVKEQKQLYNLLNRLHKVTESLFEDFVDLPRAQKRCYVKPELKEKLKYCAIFLPGDYRRQKLDEQI